MQIDIHSKTVGELALEMPNAIAVMEKWQIDYCCRGHRSIAEACETAGISAADLMNAIGEPRIEISGDWASKSLGELQRYIVDTHHVYTRQSCETIGMLAEKVARRHGPSHPEVLKVHALASAMIADLIPHMMKEEQVLFPYIEEIESASDAGQRIPSPPFGTIQNPIRMMMSEHEIVGDILVKLRAATNDYALPQDACLSFRALYERLVDLEQDLHRHIHLENNLLFPRAARLEEGPAASPMFAHGNDNCSCAG